MYRTGWQTINLLIIMGVIIYFFYLLKLLKQILAKIEGIEKVLQIKGDEKQH